MNEQIKLEGVNEKDLPLMMAEQWLNAGFEQRR